jgi:hypothetical protein
LVEAVVYLYHIIEYFTAQNAHGLRVDVIEDNQVIAIVLAHGLVGLQ